jgi:hypothetical protein
MLSVNKLENLYDQIWSCIHEHLEFNECTDVRELVALGEQVRKLEQKAREQFEAENCF